MVAQISRRTPRQARSRATVERILEAAARVLAERGYHDASTNAIAAEAGVSPGSLYQYFADKDEIVASIIRRMIDDFAVEITPALRDATTASAADGTRAVLEAVLDVLEPRAALLGALVDRVPTADQAEALKAVRARIGDFIHRMLVAQLGGRPREDLERLTWTILELTQHLPVRYLLDRPPIERPDFVADLTQMVLGLVAASGDDEDQTGIVAV